MKNVKVILWHDVEKVGRRGEQKTVSPGFARNFLYPRGLAKAASGSTLKELEHVKKRFAKEEAQRIVESKALAEKLERTSVTLEVKVNADGTLYGSVNAQALVEALKAEGILLDVKQIALAEPIKEVGVHPVPVKLHGEVTGQFRAWVVEAGGGEAKPAAGEAPAS